MAHNVESLFYVSNEANGRFVPWHRLGKAVIEAPNSADALRLAGLDWTVEQKPVYVEGNEVPNYKANTRSSDNTVLGIVTDRYKIVQNAEAFAFTDNLIGENVRYETAGSLRKGKTIWLLAQLPKTKILGDDIANYLVFCNSHDGTGAVKVCITPTRVVCNNTLNFALSTAKRSWSTKHTGDIDSKLAEARHTLKLASAYQEALAKDADRLAHSAISYDEIMKILDEIFPLTEDASDRQKANVKKAKDDIMVCYFAPDIEKFQNTKYGFINAVADFVDHTAPARMTTDYAENNWGRIIDGHPILDKAYELVTADLASC